MLALRNTHLKGQAELHSLIFILQTLMRVFKEQKIRLIDLLIPIIPLKMTPASFYKSITDFLFCVASGGLSHFSY